MKRLTLNLNLTGLIVIIAVGILLPVMLSTAVGIVAIVLAKDAGGIVTGVLVISFAVTAAGSALIAVVLASRKARLARRQADFIAGVSHEFRTPLSAIKLYAQTLQSGRLSNDPQRTAECLDTILRETLRLDTMVGRVLTWRSSSQDMLLLKMTVSPVEHAISDALERFQAMVTPDDVVITATIESRLNVRHDSGALSTVVLNLLTNAYKYTEGDKQIRLFARDEDDHVIIEVCDNGIGITPGQAKRIFQPFYRVRKQDGSDAGGVGLGLAITRYLVRRHSGTISVHSAKNSGTTFTIRLPAHTET